MDGLTFRLIICYLRYQLLPMRRFYQKADLFFADTKHPSIHWQDLYHNHKLAWLLSAGKTVILAIPPKFNTTRFFWLVRKRAS
jgi:hypothetical protein